ncbi:MAG: hypothetical protein P8N50_00995 [Actinomycetota bacterium]|jgi:hypothetical protein|nr:hypothetical protein [Actinomycetota bacterium]
MQVDGEVVRIYVRDEALHITTKAISAAIHLPEDWAIGSLEAVFDANGDGTDELILTAFRHNTLIAAVMAIDGCSLVPISLNEGTTSEPDLRHGAGRVRHISWGDLLLVFADAPFRGYAAGLIHVSATAVQQFEDGSAALAPRTWPNVVLADGEQVITPFDAEMQSDPMWGRVFTGAACSE